MGIPILVKSYLYKTQKGPHAQILIMNFVQTTGFENSLVRSSETSKNDSRTSGIPAGLVRRTAYFWFSHKLHWLCIFQTSEWYIQSTCPTDKCIQFEISKPGLYELLLLRKQTISFWAGRQYLLPNEITWGWNITTIHVKYFKSFQTDTGSIYALK